MVVVEPVKKGWASDVPEPKPKTVRYGGDLSRTAIAESSSTYPVSCEYKT